MNDKTFLQLLIGLIILSAVVSTYLNWRDDPELEKEEQVRYEKRLQQRAGGVVTVEVPVPMWAPSLEEHLALLPKYYKDTVENTTGQVGPHTCQGWMEVNHD